MLKNQKQSTKIKPVFVLYVQERIVLRSCWAKVINMQTNLKLPHIINAKIWLLPSLIKENITNESNMLVKDSNTNDFIKMELHNRNFNADVSIRKGQELAFIILLNAGKEKLKKTHCMKPYKITNILFNIILQIHFPRFR